MGILSEQTQIDFSETGLLSHARGFEYRPEQQQMAVAVAETLETETALLAEAGTGVGKSLAYLIPAIRFALDHGRKAVISTHTINLQEQLFHKDIPTVSKALNCHFSAALLKGRANYLCRTRLRRALEQANDLFNQAETKQLYDLLAWSKDCGEGSLAELPPELNISPKVWAQVCSENHVCTPRNCGYDCPYQAARRRVQEAQVVVLNHTLFFGLLSLADEMMTVEPEGPPGFIFPNDFVILDEAHTIENVAANQLGLSLSEAEMKYELLRLYNPVTHKGSMRHNASPTVLQLIEEAQAAVGEFFTATRADCQLEAHHGTVRLRQPEWTENLLSPVLRQLFAEIKDMAAMIEDNDLAKAELLDTAARILAYDEAATEMVKLSKADTTVYWVESNGIDGQFTTMRGALINVAPVLREKLFEAGRSCICTSATLSTGNHGMGYFAGRVGAESARPLQIGSPFDFARQMRIMVARSMPPPPPASQDDEYQPALADWIMRSLDESQGRAFVLFTSYSLMRAMAVRLRPFCQERGWPLLVQGDEMNRSQMVHSFRENIGSVLFGTDSFWTGVDVPGEALSNVIVTKIPFESPGNPLVEARLEDITARGGNAFRDYSLPEALLKFRQGIGRLIRSKTDTGLVTILDSRVVQKFYGSRFMYALPAAAPRDFL
ncbi:MAG: ATP-dependent DNA helicase [Akkermansia sp.]|nr:ATP-dependent DNA helicase [Akkermansia sp.]